MDRERIELLEEKRRNIIARINSMETQRHALEESGQLTEYRTLEFRLERRKAEARIREIHAELRAHYEARLREVGVDAYNPRALLCTAFGLFSRLKNEGIPFDTDAMAVMYALERFLDMTYSKSKSA